MLNRESGNENISRATGVSYGDVVFVRCMYADSIWMSGCRGEVDGQQYRGVFTTDLTIGSLVNTYRFLVRSEATGAETKPGTGVQLGDLIYLECKELAGSLLYGAYLSDKSGVRTLPYNASEATNFQWAVFNDTSSGGAPGPVISGARVSVRMFDNATLWLSGDRGTDHSVKTYAANNGAANTFVWTLLTTV